MNALPWFTSRFLSLAAALTFVGLGANPCARGQGGEASTASVLKQTLPESKQTVLGLYVTSKEAYEKWQANPAQTKLLDVRTPEEHIFVGHPEMAYNIPIALQTYELDAGKKRLVMAPNPDFIAQVKKVVTPRDTVLVICRSGSRSAEAVDQLVEAGFTSVYNIIDGVEGDKVDDPASAFHGKRMKNGWKNAGLPWTYQLDPERMQLP